MHSAEGQSCEPLEECVCGARSSGEAPKVPVTLWSHGVKTPW
jgi:hypothetical protein